MTALVVGRDGALYAGTSPDGKVYRVTSDGKAEVYFDPPDKYIWSLALMGDGSLAVGTGDTGKLYRVRAAGAQARSVAAHRHQRDARHLARVRPRRAICIAGTDPGGLVLRVSPEGKAFALFDSPLREIHALAPAPDGSVYALALSDAATGSRASTSTSSVSTQSVSASTSGGTVTGTVTTDDGSAAQAVTFGAQPQTPARSRNELHERAQRRLPHPARRRLGRVVEFADRDGLLGRGRAAGPRCARRHERQGAHLLGHRRRARHAARPVERRSDFVFRRPRARRSSPRRRIRASSSASAASRRPRGLTSRRCATRKLRRLVGAHLVARARAGRATDAHRQHRAPRHDVERLERALPRAGGRAASPARARASYSGAPCCARRRAATARVEDVSLAYLPRNVAPEVSADTDCCPSASRCQSACRCRLIRTSKLRASTRRSSAPQVQIPPRRLFQRGAVSLQWQAEDRNGDQLALLRLLPLGRREQFPPAQGEPARQLLLGGRRGARRRPLRLQGRRLGRARERSGAGADGRARERAGRGGQHAARGARGGRAAGAGRTDVARVRFTVEDVSGRLRRADVSAWTAASGARSSPKTASPTARARSYALDLPLVGRGRAHDLSARLRRQWQREQRQNRRKTVEKSSKEAENRADAAASTFRTRYGASSDDTVRGASTCTPKDLKERRGGAWHPPCRLEMARLARLSFSLPCAVET